MSRPRSIALSDGQRVGMATVRCYLGGGRYACDCDCGKTSTLTAAKILARQSCGCKRPTVCKNCGAGFMAPARYLYCDGCMVGPCAWCSKEFRRFSTRTLTCSLLCRSALRHQGRSKVVACFTCGIEIKRSVSGLGKTDRPTCSVKCRQLMRWETDRGGMLSYFRTDKNRQRMRESRLAQVFPRRSGIELKLEGEFKRLGLTFETQVPMFGRYVPDFVFRDAPTIVMADGLYWHASPAVRARDVLFNNLARRAGWRVIRLSETQINTDPAWCGRLVADSVGESRELVPMNDAESTVDEALWGSGLSLENLTCRFREADERVQAYRAWCLEHRGWYKKTFGAEPGKVGSCSVSG